MGMRINPARRDQKPVGIDVTLGRTLLAADRGDPPLGNRDVAGESRLAGPVDNSAAANDDVVHGRRSLPPLFAAPFGFRILKMRADS